MPPVRKNGCGKPSPQPYAHTSPAGGQGTTMYGAESDTDFPRKAQRTGRSSPPDPISCRSSAGNQVHPLNSLRFSVSYHTRREKAIAFPTFSPRSFRLRRAFLPRGHRRAHRGPAVLFPVAAADVNPCKKTAHGRSFLRGCGWDAYASAVPSSRNSRVMHHSPAMPTSV